MPSPDQSPQSPRRRILITGGSSGIGFAVASHLSNRDDVWLWGSRPETAQAAADLIGVRGHDDVDVADIEAVRAAVGRAVATMDGLDGVFVNAGMDGQGLQGADLSTDGFRRLLDVNVVGALNVAQAVIPHLSRPATLIFNASINALRPEAGYLDYNASKAAVVSMAKTLALELAESQRTVIALCPGYFKTRMTSAELDDPVVRGELLALIPMARIGQLDEVAEVVDFLLSPAARYMTGAVVTLDGGRSI